MSDEETVSAEDRRDTWVGAPFASSLDLSLTRRLAQTASKPIPFAASSTPPSDSSSSGSSSPVETHVGEASSVNWMEIEAPAGVEQPYLSRAMTAPPSLFSRGSPGRAAVLMLTLAHPAAGSRWLGWKG